MASARPLGAVGRGFADGVRLAGFVLGFGADLGAGFFGARGALAAGFRVAGLATADFDVRRVGVRAFDFAAFLVLPAIPPSRVTLRWPPVYSASKLHEVLADDDRAGKVTGGRLAPGFGGVSPAKGADTAIWLATSPDLERVNGRFWSDRREQPCQFRSERDQQTLWSLCEQMTAQGPTRVTEPRP